MMKFGLFGTARTSGNQEAGANDSQSYADFVAYVCEAEKLGFSSVFLAEHHFTGINQISASLSLLTYLAGLTSQIRLGTAVTVLPWHNPVLLAEQAATLDVVSNGRFEFGVGRGYREAEFDGFCINIDEAQERFDEALAIIKTAWTSKQRFSHHGKYWNFNNIVVEPSPLQQPHPPLWAAAGSERSVKKAGHEGLSLMLSLQISFAQVIDLFNHYRAALAEAGHVYRPGSVAVLRAVHLGDTREEIEYGYEILARFLVTAGSLAGAKGMETVRLHETIAENRAMLENAALIGTPSQVRDQLRDLNAQGIDNVILLNLSGSRDILRTFGKEILPAFSDKTAQAGDPIQIRA